MFHFSELPCVEVLDVFVVLSPTLLPIKSPVSSAVFCIALSEAVLSESAADCSAWFTSF